MHVDWFVLFAQLVNFLILIYLLKRFLFTPIIRAMNEREAKILAHFEEAEKWKKEAEEAAKTYEEKNASLQEQAEKMLNEARVAANRQQKEWMDLAREEVYSIQQRWHETVRQGKAAFLESLRQHTGKQVYAVAGRVLAELAEADAGQKMVALLIERIRSLDATEKEKIRSAPEDSGEGVIIRSAFMLTPEDRQRLAAAIRQLIGKPDTVIHYEESPDLISGLELLASGHRIAWSVSDYLDHLEESFEQVLDEGIRKTTTKSS